MANAITECDLGLLHQVMTDEIKAAFPALQTVEFYSLERKDLPLPACLLEMCEMEADNREDPGTEQQAVTARFEARFIIGFRTPQAKLEVRKLAGAFAAFLRKQLRFLPAKSGPAEVIGCYPDDFDPKLDEYEVWRVEWSHVLHLGSSVWTNDGTIPEIVLVSYSPEIGIGNEDKYEVLN